MGSKVHPKAFRLSTIHSWNALWFSKKQTPKLLEEDEKIRTYLYKKLRRASVADIEIERSLKKLEITIHSAKPGFVIGRSGSGIEEIKKDILRKVYPGRRVNLNINVKEVRNPSLSARVVALQIADDIEGRKNYRRSMKFAIDRVMKARAKGVKIIVKGRLNGADIARSEKLAQGRVPLHNLRADIDYAHVTARTIYGTIGVNVWVNRGEVFERNKNKKA